MFSSRKLLPLPSKTVLALLMLGLLLLLLIPLGRSQAEVAPFPSDHPTAAAAPAILVLADDPVHHRPPESDAYVIRALEDEPLGLPYTLVDDDVARFEEALLSQEWDLVIMANDQLEPTKSIFDNLDEYVRKGGRLIVHTWFMGEVPDSPLWETLGVKWLETAVVAPKTEALPIYWWQRDHPIFNDPNAKVPQFLKMANTWDKTWPVEHIVAPLKGSDPIAGYTEEPKEDATGLVVSNYGVTVFRGFVDFIFPVEVDENGNKIPDSVELWQNLIKFVLEADPRPSAFNKIVPGSNVIDAPLDVLLDWTGSARANRYAYCIDQTPGSTCDTSWRTTSSSTALITGLMPNVDYYWQARADNFYGSTYANSGTWWKFTTGDLPRYSNFLPTIMRETCTSFASTREIESNDIPADANGPLCFGFPIKGNPNDPAKPAGAEDRDWFKVNWSGNGTLAVEVTNFLYDAQVILKDASDNELDRQWWQVDGTYDLSYTGAGAAGTYFVHVFAPEGHPTDSGDYTLTISVQ